MSLPIISELVYGPIRSRRLGISLGVNVFPAGRKICNFNCAYCQYGWTCEREDAVGPDQWPSPDAIAAAVADALATLTAQAIEVKRITFAGSGEPTLHPRFGEIVDALRRVRDEKLPSARIAILTNGGTLGRPAVVDALRRIDEAYVKLDTVDPDIFRRLNGSRSGLAELLETLPRLPHVTIQSLFTRDASGRIDNTTPAAIEQWLAAVRTIKPDAVHVYSLDRDPAWPELQRVARDELEKIAERVRGEGIDALVF